MKDLLLLDSKLSLDFWAEAMGIANYSQNKLSTKSQQGKLIPEEAWTLEKQDVSHLKVFGSLVRIEIPKKKCQKSDI